MRRLAIVAGICVLASAGIVSSTTASSTSMESLLLKQVNAGRARIGLRALIVHTGLRSQARKHSADMAADGGIGHAGFAGRVDRATPDPAESNGAPDGGFVTNGACENVAWIKAPGRSDSSQAKTVYDGWYGSSGHKHCMLDEGAKHTVTGIGVYESSDGGYWITLEAVNDKTLPKSATPSPGTPSFAATDPCGRAESASWLGGGEAYRVSAKNSKGGRVTLRAVALPSWASFASTAGTTAKGTLRAEPGAVDWLRDVLGPSSTATIEARNAGGVTKRCTFTITAALL